MQIAWQPNPGQQTEALRRTEFEILYGGARGGGKTDAGIVWPTRWVSNDRLRALVVRRNADDLKDWIDRAETFYALCGAKKVGTPAEFHFPSGAKIRTGHLKDKSAFTKYRGHEYQKMIVEELTDIESEDSYEKLIGSCRSTVDGLDPQVFATTNPDGVGHEWVKQRFVEVAEPGTAYSYTDEATELALTRIFIPAKVEDNPILVAKDPRYVAWLNNLKDPVLRKAWREGSWDLMDIDGAYYARDIQQAITEGRICNVPFERNLPVHTWWDLGMNDTMSVVCVQYLPKEIRLIDYIHGEGEGLGYYITILKERYGDNLDEFNFPHDISVREMGPGESRLQSAQKLGVKKFRIAPRQDVLDGINAVRAIFNMFWIDKVKCKPLISALKQYRKEYDDKNQVYKNHPLHNWASHPSDAVRTGAMLYREKQPSPPKQPPRKRPYYMR